MPKEKRYEYRFLGSKKHKAVALLLCVFGGFLGLHYFYVRKVDNQDTMKEIWTSPEVTLTK